MVTKNQDKKEKTDKLITYEECLEIGYFQVKMLLYGKRIV